MHDQHASDTDPQRTGSNLSSSIRMYVLEYFKAFPDRIEH